jgi:N-methylhydantoinase B
MTNTSNLPVEALEVEYPLTVLRYELVDGSGGAGRSRGGMGFRRVYRAEAECHLRLDGSRLLTPPRGIAGGHPGGRGDFRFGDGVEPFVNGAGSLRAGETVEIVTPGAGGLGPPAERGPAAVGRDLADGRIDLATAAAIYRKQARADSQPALLPHANPEVGSARDPHWRAEERVELPR